MAPRRWCPAPAMRFDLTTLNLVLAIADTRSITRGAEREHLALAAASKRLSDLEARLDPAQFVRVHRSWIINLAQLKNIERLAKDSFVAVLHTGQQVPISRAGHERIKALI